MYQTAKQLRAQGYVVVFRWSRVYIWKTDEPIHHTDVDKGDWMERPLEAWEHTEWDELETKLKSDLCATWWDCYCSGDVACDFCQGVRPSPTLAVFQPAP